MQRGWPRSNTRIEFFYARCFKSIWKTKRKCCHRSQKSILAHWTNRTLWTARKEFKIWPGLLEITNKCWCVCSLQNRTTKRAKWKTRFRNRKSLVSASNPTQIDLTRTPTFCTQSAHQMTCPSTECSLQSHRARRSERDGLLALYHSIKMTKIR